MDVRTTGEGGAADRHRREEGAEEVGGESMGLVVMVVPLRRDYHLSSGLLGRLYLWGGECEEFHSRSPRVSMHQSSTGKRLEDTTLMVEVGGEHEFHSRSPPLAFGYHREDKEAAKEAAKAAKAAAKKASAAAKKSGAKKGGAKKGGAKDSGKTASNVELSNGSEGNVLA